MPDFRDKFLEGTGASESVGTVRTAGLPNITGSITSTGIYGIGSVREEHVQSNGALEATQFNKYAESGQSTYSAYMGGININASRSNSIYGNSDTVQPNSVLINYIIKY